MQPAQIKLHPDENFLHHAKIQPPYFAGQVNDGNGWENHNCALLHVVPWKNHQSWYQQICSGSHAVICEFL